jgi:predicted nucleic acid-binding protein
VTRYLLDTDAIVDWTKDYGPTVLMLRRLMDEDNEFCTCAVVVAEIETGLMPEDEVRAMALLRSCVYLDCSWAAARQAGRWRHQYSPPGRTRPLGDFIIAATAYSHGATVVTGNARHFTMPDLQVLETPRQRR